MKRILPLLVLSLALTAPPVWGGGCDTPSCQHSPELPAPDPLGQETASQSVQSTRHTRGPKVREDIIMESPWVIETCNGGECQGSEQLQLEPLSPKTKNSDEKDGLTVR